MQMILRLALLPLLPLLIAASSVPQAGSSVRRDILNALRPAIEAKLGPNIEFVVTSIRVEKDWAFVMAEPQRRGGKPIDGRAYFPDMWDNMDGLTTTAILRRVNGRWKLMDSAIGATDVWYCGPPAIARMRGVCVF